MNDYQLPLPIVTPRLVIRQAVRSDMRGWSALYRSPKVRQHLNGPLKRRAQEWWKGHQISLGKVDQQLSVVLTETNEFVGVCGFFDKPDDQWEVWLMLRSKFWRKAMGAEITSVLARVAFESFSAKRVIGIVDPANHASLKLFKTLGFSFVSVYIETSNWQNGHHIYGLDFHTYESTLKSAKIHRVL